jgi:hypothetical protein
MLSPEQGSGGLKRWRESQKLYYALMTASGVLERHSRHGSNRPAQRSVK